MRFIILLFLLYRAGFCGANDSAIHYFRPFIKGSLPLTIQKISGLGRCTNQSQLIKREDAYQCTLEGTIYDPCFVQPGTKDVFCIEHPWAHIAWQFAAVIDESKTTEPLDVSRTYPWAMELSSGQHCLATVVDKEIDNMPLRYKCDDNTLLLGHLQRCKPEWSMQARKENGLIGEVQITAAWF